MTYGVTPTGFVVKRFDDIKTEMEAALRAKFGEIDTDADSTFGQIIGVFSQSLSEIWDQCENIYNSEYPSTAEGVSLDNACSFTGVKRIAASFSSDIVAFKGDSSTLIPAGTIVSQQIALNKFETTADLTMSLANCVKTVISVEDVQDTTLYIMTISGEVFSFTTGTGATKASIALAFYTQIIADTVLIPILTATYVSGDDNFTLMAKDTSLIGVFSFSTPDSKIIARELWNPAAVKAIVAGVIPAPIHSVNIIDTPIYGIYDVINFQEGILGNDIESDAALRIRRRQSLNIIAAGTLGAILSRVKQDIPEVTNAFIFENATGNVDSMGNPPYSFQLIVAALNTAPINQKIADKIWERKPAGIATNGTTTMTVVDTNGENQIVKFSHSVTKYVWVKLQYSITGSDQIFPINGEELIKNRVVEIGAGLTFGSDLLIQLFSSAVYASPGVVSCPNAYLAVKNNSSDTPAPGDYVQTNVVILQAEYPTFDITRVILEKV